MHNEQYLSLSTNYINKIGQTRTCEEYKMYKVLVSIFRYMKGENE